MSIGAIAQHRPYITESGRALRYKQELTKAFFLLPLLWIDTPGIGSDLSGYDVRLLWMRPQVLVSAGSLLVLAL